MHRSEMELMRITRHSLHPVEARHRSDIDLIIVNTVLDPTLCRTSMIHDRRGLSRRPRTSPRIAVTAVLQCIADYRYDGDINDMECRCIAKNVSPRMGVDVLHVKKSHYQ